MPGYVILTTEIADPEGYEEFKRLAEEAIAKHGGRYLARGGRLEAAEGDWFSRVVLLEFPSFEAALAFYRSAEYKRAQAIRLETATSAVAIFDGVEREPVMR